MNEPKIVELEAGTYYFCMCGQSKNKPFCDGTHLKMYSDMNNPIFPEKLEVTESQKVSLCQCGNSGNKPYCDGSHAKIEG